LSYIIVVIMLLIATYVLYVFDIFFFFQAEDGIRDGHVTGVRRVLFRSGRVDVLAAPDHRLIGPDVQGHVRVGILEGRGHVSMAPFLFVLLTVGTDHRRVSEPEPEEQHERGGRQRYEKLGSHVDRSSEVPVDADEDLVPPVAQRTLFDEAPKIHAVPDEEGDVLPGIELRL